MIRSIPLVGQALESKELLTQYQGYVRARGGFVEINCPGLYDGAPLPWDKALKIARNGILSCRDSMQRKKPVVLRIPGSPDRQGPPEQVLLFFKKLLRAAEQAKQLAEMETRIFQLPRGV